MSKLEVLYKARQEGANEAVLEARESLSDHLYESPVAITREIG